MLNRENGKGKWLTSSIYAYFSLWLHSLRTALMLIFVLLMTFMLTETTKNSISARHFEVYMGETLFKYANNGFNLIMTSVAYMVMMSEIPKRISYQNYAMMRLSRMKWLCSLIVFCMLIAFLYIIAMFSFSALLSMSFVSPGGGWSDIERLATYENYEFMTPYTSEYIRIMHPMKACVLALFIQFLFYTTVTFIILVFSLHEMPTVGIVFCISMVLLGVTILFEYLPPFPLLSHFATLSGIESQVYENKFQHIAKCIAGYFVVIALLIASMVHRVKRMDVRFMEKE